MPKQGFQALAAELRATPPDGLRKLSAADLNDLAAAVRDVRTRQGAELAAAGEQSLRFIPRLLRGPLRRVLG